MNVRRLLTVVAILAFAWMSLGSNCAPAPNNSVGPGTTLPPHHCDVSGRQPSGLSPPPVNAQPFCDYANPGSVDNPKGCFCSGYDGTLPATVYDWSKTKSNTACGNDLGCEGCSSKVHFAWP